MAINVNVKMVMVMALVVTMAVNLGGQWAGAQVPHVVGGDRGWDPSSDVQSWSSGRSFRVGDKVWFAYSAAEGYIIELKSRDEYESCDVRNPLRMYTDGLNSIPLDGEGTRYFISSNPENCKNGLKLNVIVMPLGTPRETQPTKVGVSENSVSTNTKAAAPTSPSGSAQLCGSFVLLMVSLWLFYVAV